MILSEDATSKLINDLRDIISQAELVSRWLRSREGSRSDRERYGPKSVPEAGLSILTAHVMNILAGLEVTAGRSAKALAYRRFVYFVSDGKAIKIGCSNNPMRRLSELRQDKPMATLVGMMSGGEVVERQLHHRFAADCINGEWFEDTPKLRSMMVSHAFLFDPAWVPAGIDAKLLKYTDVVQAHVDGHGLVVEDGSGELDLETEAVERPEVYE